MKKKIISIQVNQGKLESFTKELLTKINHKKGGYACFSNVHMLVEAYDDKSFAEAVNNSTYTFPDGVPIAKSFKFIHGLEQERIAGMDFLPHFLKISNKNKLKVGFIGGSEETLNKTKIKIENEFPDINITTMISPPFNGEWNNLTYINMLNQTQTDVIFIALGCPKQEKWMYENFASVNGFMFGIGGALLTYTELVKRAPKWMQKYGLEWFYRLSLEPKRMFKRYFYTNTKFFYLLFKEKLKIAFNG
jgi:N-acetylglucosaminyldiphosphoundecaprenol N-acetyl-beta-D-mannosaminyltransferase